MKTSREKCYEITHKALMNSQDSLLNGDFEDAFFQLGYVRGVTDILHLENVLTKEQYEELVKVTDKVEESAKAFIYDKKRKGNKNGKLL